MLSIFLGFNYKASSLIKEQLHRQGQAFLQEIVLTREWAANHGGVYVLLTPGMEVNPFLSQIPGSKAVVEDRDGNRYTLKNPALMTREISELAAKKGIFQFRITSLKPLNPANEPGQFERSALKAFEKGSGEYSIYDQKGGQVLYRYMTPLITQEACLKCHAHQGYHLGDLRGGISVTIDATEVMQQLHKNKIFLMLSGFGVIFLIFAIIWSISQSFINKIKVAELKLVKMASTDFLTGLLNRRELFNRIAIEVSRAKREAKPISIIIIDIDKFKTLNDTYGHQAGDVVLKELSRCFTERFRGYDIIARYGGEEFLVAAPETTLEQARELAERLRVAVMNMSILYEDGALPIKCTISAGVAWMQDDEDVERTISRADEALYRAKNEGRNRVSVA
ncbi:MAG: diguanylate cyclase [Proteobacteria bacterium]|nr:diguanylate cyclase [Pseudomonadota bacterium]